MVKHSCNFVATAAIFLIINIIATSALKGGYEHVHTYKYDAKINVGVDGHVSEYNIDGLLKIQRDVKSDRYMLLLTDLKHKSNYGDESFPRVNESSPIDNNILQVPFYAVYDETGRYKATEHPKNEPAWSEKIKRSIASLLQFNWPIIQKSLSNERRSYGDDIQEVTEHGKCKVDYGITKMHKLSAFNENILLMKSYSLNSCDDFTDDVNGYLTNYEFTKKTIEDISKWGSSEIRNIYQLDVVGGVPTIKRMSNIESYKYNDNIDNVVFIKDNRQLLVEINQNLIFDSASPDEEFFEDFKTDEDIFTSFYADYANVMDGKGLINKTEDLLLEVLDYMEKDHLSIIDRGSEHRQVFNKILSFLKRLKTVDFFTLDLRIIDNPKLSKIRNVFLSMLPYVGTEHSHNFMLDKISYKYISDDLAITLLTTLPTHAPLNIETVKLLKSFVFDNNSGELQLSPKVYESGVLSFSHLLNRFCDRFSDYEVAQDYLPYIVRAFEAAQKTTSKLVFLSALGNIRDRATAKYILPILSRQNDNAKDQDRLRIAAINILSELDSEENVKSWTHSNLTAIIKDKSESRSIRSAAYDVLVMKSEYEIDNLADIGRMVSDDKDLYNYHLSTIEGLQQVGILNSYSKMAINPSGTTVSSSLSRSVIVKTDNLFKPELLKSSLKLQSVPQTYLKLSIVNEDQSITSNWRIPSLLKFEILEGSDEKLIVNKAFYFYTNFNRMDLDLDPDKEAFFDFWTIFNQNTRLYYVDTIEFKNLPNLLELSDIILRNMHEKLTFMYEELTTFSLKTGFVDAVFEHKYPSLISMRMDYNWNAEDTYLEAKVNFSLESWSNGYSGVSVYNPFSGLTHSIRKTQMFDQAFPISLIVKYDFSKHELNLTIPVNSKDPKPKESGLAIYSSTSVLITDANDEISCQNCGFKVATKYGPRTNLRFRRSDYLGLLVSHMTYNCDPESPDIQSFLSSSDDGRENVVNTCGFIATIRPNSSKPISQIELLVNADYELSKSWEKPWYFLPGYKLHFESSIGTRYTDINEVIHLLKLDFNTSSSQGHFSNLLQFRVAKRNDDNSNFVLCFDGKADFPETDDNHLPAEITQSKLNAFSRVVMGQSEDDTCSSVDFAVDFDLTGEVSDTQKDMLESYTLTSQCAKQKDNPLYYYPRGSYPLTEDCVREMIANTTLRRYKLDLTSEKFSDLSLLQALLIIRSTQDKLKEMASNTHCADVEINMISPISEIRTRKQMSFQADYPVPDIYRNLPNIYFPQQFVLDFIDKKITVVNVYPKLIVYNNEEKSFPGSNDWNEIYTGVEKAPYQIYAKSTLADEVSNEVADDQMSLKILYKGHELILKPNMVTSALKESSNIPDIYYNRQLFSDFNQRLHLFSSEKILFSLSRVDDYMVIRSTEIPVTIYYTTTSVTIFQERI